MRCYCCNKEKPVFHIVNQLNTSSEQPKNALWNQLYEILQLAVISELQFLRQMSKFLVNTRNQPPHNPDVISHLVRINNPPS